MTCVAKALGDGDLVDHLYRCIGQFEQASGTNFMEEVKLKPKRSERPRYPRGYPGEPWLQLKRVDAV